MRLLHLYLHKGLEKYADVGSAKVAYSSIEIKSFVEVINVSNAKYSYAF